MRFKDTSNQHNESESMNFQEIAEKSFNFKQHQQTKVFNKLMLQKYVLTIRNMQHNFFFMLLLRFCIKTPETSNTMSYASY